MKFILPVSVFFFSSLNGAGYKFVSQEEDALGYASKYVIQLEEMYAGVKTVAIRAYVPTDDSSSTGKISLGYVVLDLQSAQSQGFSIILPNEFEYNNYIRIIGHRFDFATRLELIEKKLTATPLAQVLRKNFFRKMLDRFRSR